ncbi:MAG: hypothetical protein HY327_07445 [Chloroflexi bacterium]|nr:hypothetical protein [Chloroflexota bacterium]
MTAVLLALLSGFYLREYYPGYSALIVVGVAAYGVVEFVGQRLPHRAHNLARYALCAFVVFLIVIVPTLLEIILRRGSAPFDHIHDGALQSEVAMQFLLAGQIPFGQNYAATTLGQWQHHVIDPAINFELQHYLYLPATFLLPIPVYLLTQNLFGWFDIRIISIIAFALLWMLLPQMTSSWDDKLGLLIAFGLNPLFVPFFIEGRNDISVLLWLVSSFLTMQRGRTKLSAALFALACVTKATAWLVAPFYLTHLWLISAAKRKIFFQSALVFGVVFTVVILPFAIWNMRSLAGDVLVLGEGASTKYVWGYGISMILLTLGLLPDRLTAFPFWALQFVFGLLTMIVSLRYQARRPFVRTLITASAAFTFVIFFFSRNLIDNYLGFALSLALIAYFIPNESRVA